MLTYDGNTWTGAKLMKLNNQSGETLNRGDVVIISTTRINSCTTTLSTGDNKVVGAIAFGGVNGAEVSIAISGIWDVLIRNGGYSIRQSIKTTSLAGNAIAEASFSSDGIFGWTLASGEDGPRLVKCNIKPKKEMY
jgi:hypothetical protein